MCFLKVDGDGTAGGKMDAGAATMTPGSSRTAGV
jgi:hypothetical protein